MTDDIQERLNQAALNVSRDAPAKKHSSADKTYVSWDVLLALRAALEAAGIGLTEKKRTKARNPLGA